MTGDWSRSTERFASDRALRGLLAWSASRRRAFRLEELPALLEQGTGVDVGAVVEKWLAPPLRRPPERTSPDGRKE